MRCELENIDIALDRCPVNTCMYNSKGQCTYSKLHKLLDGMETTEARVAAMQRVGFDSDVIESSMNRIKFFLYTNAYCQYALEKNLMEASQEELSTLQKAPARFDAWKAAREDTFKFVVKVLEEVKNSKVEIKPSKDET